MKKISSNKLGLWGEIRKNIMKKNNPQILVKMEKNKTLYPYLENYQIAVEQRVESLLKKFRQERGINENLWRSDPFEFVIKDLEVQSDIKKLLEEEIKNTK